MGTIRWGNEGGGVAGLSKDQLFYSMVDSPVPGHFLNFDLLKLNLERLVG